MTVVSTQLNVVTSTAILAIIVSGFAVFGLPNAINLAHGQFVTSALVVSRRRRFWRFIRAGSPARSPSLAGWLGSFSNESSFASCASETGRDLRYLGTQLCQGSARGATGSGHTFGS